VKDRPSTLEIGGVPVDVSQHMPMVLINPQITPQGREVSGPEGCLSFPEMYADITRPECVEVRAQNERAEQLEFRCGGLLARAIQHEYDHLQGILFIDRMTAEARRSLRAELDDLQAETKASLKAGR
jgi:peptide deformylase